MSIGHVAAIRAEMDNGHMRLGWTVTVERSEDLKRIEIARCVLKRKHHELGTRVRAAACYGSVAHRAAREHSDVELTIITDETVPYEDEYFFEQGTLVECTLVSEARMLAAARLVPVDWGIKSDQYRHHHVLYDPDQFFPRLWSVANDLAPSDFDQALAESWWHVYELRGKVHNAVADDDVVRAIYTAWTFAYWTAMRIALHERRPYESGRTLWREVANRGYGMPELVDGLVTGRLPEVGWGLETAWERTSSWGAPPQD